MTVAIIGLGLIGGSLAKSYKEAGHEVLAYDKDKAILEFAVMSKVADKALTLNSGGDGKPVVSLGCDLILIALYPCAAIEFLQKNAPFINRNTTVIDCCGNKKNICEVGFELAEKHGFTFVGGHPMAGKEQSGFKHSSTDLFKNASMIIVPPKSKVNDIVFFNKIKEFLEPAGFARLTVTTAEKHDMMIAFTSQMAHLVSNAFIKSPTVLSHKGFSAGSYKDLTRVAWLNEFMWTELFMENRQHLLHELDIFISSLQEYKSALELQDSNQLQKLLYDGKILKEKVDRQ
jgi:prephenate dehydrogenase